MKNKKHSIGKTERKVINIGDSFGITLPKSFVETHGLKKGDKVLVYYNSLLLLEPQKGEHILEEIKTKLEKLKKEEMDNE